MLLSKTIQASTTTPKISKPFEYFLSPFFRRWLIGLFFYIGIFVPITKGIASLDNAFWGVQLLYLMGVVGYNVLLLFPLFKFQDGKFNLFFPLLFFTILELTFNVFKSFNDVLALFNWYELFKPDASFYLPYSRPVAAYPIYDLLFAASKEQYLKMLALAGVYIGFLYAPNWSLPQLGFPILRARKINSALALIFMCFFSLLLYYIFVYKGGIEKTILSWQFGRSKLINDPLNFLKPFLILPAFVLVLWYLLLPQIVKNPIYWLVLVMCSFGSYFVNGSRTIFFVPYLLLFILYTLQSQRINWQLLLGLSFFVFLGVGILGAFRLATFEGKVNWAVFSETSFTQLFEQSNTGLKNRYQVGSYTLPLFAKVPNEVDYLYGKTYVGVISILVPRVLWEDKPRGAGIYNKEIIFGGSGGGYPIHAAAEAFWNFGILGVLLIHLFFGFFLKQLYRYYLKHKEQSLFVVLYILSIFILKPTSLALVKYMQIILPMFLLLWAVGLVKILKTNGSSN